MAYLVVNPNGDEFLVTREPFKSGKLIPTSKQQMKTKNWETTGEYIKLEKGSIYKLIGRNLKTDDKPVRI